MITLIIIWVFCAAISYGGFFAYSQKEYPWSSERDYREDLAMSIFIGILGPIGFIVVLVSTGFYKHGFKFW